MSSVTDDIVEVIVQGCGSLEVLNLHDAPLTDKALQALGRCCPSLTELDLSASFGDMDRDGYGGEQCRPDSELLHPSYDLSCMTDSWMLGSWSVHRPWDVCSGSRML